jgi:hypothetical protein
MMVVRQALLTLLVTLALSVCGSGQDIEYATLDRMFVKPDLPLRAVAGQGQIRLLAYHSYPTSLHHFRLIARSDCLDVRVEPAQMDEFKPTTIESFALWLTVKGKPPADRVSVFVGMTADELRSQKEIAVRVPLTKKAEQEVNESLAMPVGEIEVYVRRFGEEIYYLYVIPIFALVGWLLWRKRRAARVRMEE